ncbi:MAG TPA: 23S rRNA (uracil(1939)-C(5))-methyltransferase RlmD [Terracidiphilus sp.]|nr:23S rRNA (uracil(1939)-C(5))-methyltransferase RlmD [Terracidiphilus sp.]
MEAPREKPPLTPPQLVKIEKPIYGGAFLARVEGKAVFVPLTLPGETARVRVTADKRGYSTAEVDEIVAPAAERITPACRHFGTCGGCQYQHAGYATQLAFKQAILRETLERGGVRAPEEISTLAAKNEFHAWGYRNRIRLAFDAQGNPGYRGRRSNAVIPIAECPIAAPVLVTSAQIIAEVSKQLAPPLRPTEVSLFCDAAETALLASVLTESATRGRFEDFARALGDGIPALKGVEFVATGRDGDRAANESPRTVAQWGEPSLAYRAAGFDYRVDHGAFFQVNRWLVDGLAEAVAGGGTERTAVRHGGDVAWDLFAGVGLFARKLTEGFGRVIAVESAASATAALAANLRGTVGTAVHATTLDFLRRNKTDRPDLIVVDPPRAGLGTEITELLGGICAPALTYVSCDPATLARDLRALLASGYAIESLTLADLFPQTFHLESVVHLRLT